MNSIILPSTKNQYHPDYAHGCWFCDDTNSWKTSVSIFGQQGYFKWTTKIDELCEEDKSHVVNELIKQGRTEISKEYSYLITNNE